RQPFPPINDSSVSCGKRRSVDRPTPYCRSASWALQGPNIWLGLGWCDARQHPYIRQVTVLFRIVESVANDELIWNRKAYIVCANRQLAAGGLIQQHGNADPPWLVALQKAFEEAQSQAGIKDVFHQNNILV